MLSRFKQVWLVDFEFQDHGAPHPTVHCLVARELQTKKTIRMWQPHGQPAPYDCGADCLFISFYSIAEMRSHLALGWPMPPNIVDLFCEFRCLTNGKPLPSGKGLLGAMDYFGLAAHAPEEKATMRELAIRGAPFSEQEHQALLDYCEADVNALEKLVEVMAGKIDLPRALIRGRYMAALAQVEVNGIPLDVPRLDILRRNWDAAKFELVQRIDSQYGVYEGITFSRDRFLDYLKREHIPWPYHPTGSPMLDDDTFKDMARAYPKLQSLRELRYALGKMRLTDLAVGPDGRNRCMLSPFGSITGRNQPSNSRFIFGPATWMRGLIKPEPGKAIAYLDFGQQEFAIAAKLSGDEGMMRAYASADPYLTFAKVAGLVPPDATKETHPDERDRCKIVLLALQFGMGAESLGNKLGLSPAHGKQYLDLHKSAFPKYWKFCQAVLDHVMFYGSYTLRFGWTLHLGPDTRPNTVKNFPVQGSGAEMLRVAIIRAVQRGVKVLAPVHDALLIEADAQDIDDAAAVCQDAMREASLQILPDFPVRTDAKIVRWPDRYMDKRGQRMWNELWSIPLLAQEVSYVEQQ